MRNKLEKQFDLYNKKYFGGKLPEARVKWDKKILRREDALGVCISWRCGCKGHPHPDTHEINIATEIRFSGRWTRHVLLHEMCHLKLKHRTDTGSHGPKFQNEMLRLAKLKAFKDLW
jgi:predicted metal-dependent hydrolase